MGQIDEQILINSIINGNLTNYSKLIDKYGTYLYSLILGIVKNPDTATDLCQDVFIKIYLSLQVYDQRGFKTWISKIAINKSIDYLRRQKREDCVLVDDFSRLSAVNLQVDDFGQLEKRQQVIDLLKDLPPKYKIALYLFYFEDKSYREISQQLGIGLKAVEARIYRGKKILKEKIIREESS